MKKYLLLTTFILLVLTAVNGQDPQSDAARLLRRINLDRPGLEKVKAAMNDPVQASAELLSYYRARTSVKHPVDRNARPDGKPSAKEMETADNAMKHIFVGQSAYPPYFCGEDINWGFRPVPDNEWVWQLNRMNFWQAMANVYWMTGEEKYAREWCTQLLDWTRKNPRDKAHDYAWRSIETGIRGHSWTILFQRFLDAPSFTPEVLVAFLNSFHEHASYLMTVYRTGSNWALMEAEGLAFIAMTFPEFSEADAWNKEAIRRLNAEITKQVYPDGHQRELAIGYHNGCIGWFTRTYDLAAMNGKKDAFPESYRKTIEKMCEVSLKLGFPDGSNPQFGDSWTGDAGHLWPSLLEWGKLYNRPDFIYVATKGKEGKMPASTAFALESSGFYSMRSGWNSQAICLVLKCGPDGGGHCQPDNGTFELYAGGRHLMPDAGSFIYSGDPENRAWFRQTKVHQTLTLDGKNAAYAPRLLLWKPGKDLDLVVVENAGYPELTHRRAVLFVDKKYFVIVDEALGNATGNIDLHFQFAPGKAVFDPKNFSARTDFHEGWNLLVRTAPQPGMQLKEEEGQVSFIYTKKEPRPAFCYNILKSSNEQQVRYVTVLTPYEKNQPEVNARVIGNPAPGASHMELEISVNGKKRKISYDL
jgi:heparan-sulfate lyase